MKRLLTCAFFLATLSAWAVDLDVRHIYVTNDISGTRPSVAALRWYGGESVKLDMYIQRGTAPVDLSGTGLYARIEAFLATNRTSAYLMNTGVVASATNGYITFDLTPEQANLSPSNYLAYVKLYQPISGTNRYIGTVWKSDLQVFWGPSATNFVYQGPYTNAVETDPIFVASVAYRLTVADTSYWYKAITAVSNEVDDVQSNTNYYQTAYGWGNHAAQGYLKAGSNVSVLVNDSGYVSTNTFDSGTNGAVVAAKDYTDAATQGLVTASITNAVLPLDGSQAMAGTLQVGAEKISGGGNTIWLGGVADTLFYGTSFSPGTNVLYDLGTVSLYWRNVYAQDFYGNGANITGILYATTCNVASNVPSSLTNYIDNMATKTNFANMVVDGTLNLGTNSITNVTCIAIGTNNSGLGKIILPASTSTNDGMRFGDDVYMYRTAAANLGVLGAFHTYSGLRTPSIYSEGVDLAIGPAGADGKVLSINIGAVQSLLIHTNGAVKTVTLTATNNNGMSVGAGPNLLTLGQGGPVVITGTNFFFYNSESNWAGSWADYTGYYHGINSNGAIRVLTNAWGW